MSFGLYNGKSVACTWGSLELNDMRADEFVRVAPQEAAFVVIKGSDGSMTRCATNNTHHTITVTLKRSSKVHALLSAAHAADQLTDGGAGVAPFMIKDPNGSTLQLAESAWITQAPEAGLGKEAGPDVSWVFDAQIMPGGNIIGGNQL